MLLLADGIDVEWLAVGCFTPCLLIFGIPWLEAAVSASITNLRPGKSYNVWLFANLLSSFGGLIVLWSFGGRFIFWEAAFRTLGPDKPAGNWLLEAMNQTWRRCLAYYLESVLVEWFVWRLAANFQPDLRARRLLLAVMVANLVSYLVLWPLLATGLRADFGPTDIRQTPAH